MRAAKGIFRTVDEPLGQVDARPSKSYRISWIGVCSLARSQNDTPQLSESWSAITGQSLLVRWKIRFSFGLGSRPGSEMATYATLFHVRQLRRRLPAYSRSTLSFSAMKTANWAKSPRRSASAMSARTRRCKASRWRYFSESSAASTCSSLHLAGLAQQGLRQQRALDGSASLPKVQGPAIAQENQRRGYAKPFKGLGLAGAAPGKRGGKRGFRRRKAAARNSTLSASFRVSTRRG